MRLQTADLDRLCEQLGQELRFIGGDRLSAKLC